MVCLELPLCSAHLHNVFVYNVFVYNWALQVKSWCLSQTALSWELFLICAPVLIHNHEVGGILETPVVQQQLQLEPHCSNMLTPLWQCEQKQVSIKVEAHVKVFKINISFVLHTFHVEKCVFLMSSLYKMNLFPPI